MLSIWLILVASLTLAFAAACEEPDNLLTNGSFASDQAKDGVPSGWTVWRPLVDNAACTVRAADGGLRDAGGPQGRG